MSIFDLVLTGLREIGKKILNSNDLKDENADFDYFRPFLACFWLVLAPYKFSKLSMSIFDLFLTRLSEIGKKILNNNDI